MSHTDKRTRATGIIERPEGILVVGTTNSGFSLPNKGFNKDESGMAAITRKLKDQTRLFIHTAIFLFEHESVAIRYEVYWIKVIGTPKSFYPAEEIDYYRIGSECNINSTFKEIIERYYQYKREHGNAMFQKIFSDL